MIQETPPREKGLLIIGGGGHGRVVAEAAAHAGRYKKIALVDPRTPAKNIANAFLYISSENDIGASPQDWYFIVAVGDPLLRERLYDQYVARGFMSVPIIHPYASVSPSAEVSEGVVVFAGAVIATLAQIKTGVIVNHGAIIEHDCRVEAFAHIAPGAVLAGQAEIGAGAFLGANASVRHGKKIAPRSVIGNGAAVVDDIGRPGVYGGVPARLIKAFEEA